MGENGLTRKEEIFLTEYQAAQSSAEHHDTLVWTVTSIIWAANLVLLGFILDSINNKTDLKCLILALSALGILLCVSVWIFACQFRKIKCHKYNRCKDIEKILGMKQHLSLPSSGGQWCIYSIIMAVFIVLWIGVICFVLVYL